MFDNIEEMEKEIETFRQNIMASSELVESLSALTSETKRQREEFAAQSTALTQKVEGCVQQFKTDHDSALDALSKKDAKFIADLQNHMDAEKQNSLEEIRQIQVAMEKSLNEATQQSDKQIAQLTSECNQIVSAMRSTAQEQQNAYFERLQKTESIIKDYQNDAALKYKDFVQKLESTNVSELFDELQELKQSVQTKFTIMMAGVGAAVLVGILNLVLR